MTSSVNVEPVLHENKETRGIISTDQFNLNVEMPDQYKIWLKTPKTNLSSSGASFQSVNTNRFMDSSVRVDLKCKIELTGETVASGNLGGATYNLPLGTPPYLWSHVHSGVEPFAVNKLINQLNFNIQNKQWSEEQRNPQLIDILSSQFDQDKLKKEGILPFKEVGIAQLDDIYGRGIISREDYNTLTIDTADVGVENGLTNRTKELNSRELAIKNQYITIDKVTFTTTQTGVTLSAEKDARFGNAYVPKVGGNVYYSTTYTVADPDTNPPTVAVNTLTQVVEFTIHEYIISPSLSNPYTKNPYSKSYYVGAYPVNITMNFDPDYYAHMFKNQLWRVSNAVGDTVGGRTLYTPTVTSTSFEDANLFFYTFDTLKTYVNPYQHVLYYDMSSQNTQEVIRDKSDTSLQNSNIVTSNLSSLPPYIIGFISTSMAKNSALVQAHPARNNSRSQLATYVLNPIQNVTLHYGSQTDCMLGTNLSWREIVDMTLDVMGNDELRDVLLGLQITKDGATSIDKTTGSHSVDTASSVWNGLNQNFNTISTATLTGASRDQYWMKPTDTIGLPFFIIPTARLNWRPISQANVVTIPEWNYGSNHYKSLVMDIDWYLNDQFAKNTEIATDPKITCTPHVYLCTKRVRSIPMDGDGPMADERIEYDYFNNVDSLASKLSAFYARNNSSNNVNHELQYVGGSFLGDVLNTVKKALPAVASATRAIHGLTKGREGALGKIGDYTGLASQGLSSIGMGKRRVGRPSARSSRM